MRLPAWEGSGFRSVRSGASAGVTFGLLGLAFGKSVGDAAIGGVLFGALYGAFMPRTRWERGPVAPKLTTSDRIAVETAVRTGSPIEDRRLARAVVEYAKVVTSTARRSATWLLVLFCAGALAAAVYTTVNASTRAAIAWWALFALWSYGALRAPSKRARSLARAASAEHAAQAILAGGDGDRATDTHADRRATR